MIDTNDKSARTFEISAKNFEEGKAQAEAEYSKDGEVSCYLLEKEKKGFFGIGATPCRIRVTVTPRVDVINEVLRADSKAAGRPSKENAPRAPKEQTRKPQGGAKETPKPKRDNAPKTPKDSVSADGAQKDSGAAKDNGVPKENSAPKAPKDNSKDQGNQKKSPKGAKPVKESAKAPKKDDAAPQEQKTEARQPKAKKEVRRERENLVISQSDMDIALEFINTLLKNMESEAKAVQAEAPEGAVFEGVYPRIEIVGDKSGILIGHHGETMDAIQFLANLCLNRKTGVGGREFVKIVVDIENYREKREETLRALARRMAARALKYKRNVVLEPMNPYERHIIHAELQDMENIDTHSVGSDENRKVVITYEGEDKQEGKGRSGGGRGNRGRGGSGRGERTNHGDRSGNRGERSEEKRSAQPSGERPKVVTLIDISEEESAAIKEAYEAYQEEKAGKERPRRASSIDEILGGGDGLF